MKRLLAEVLKGIPEAQELGRGVDWFEVMLVPPLEIEMKVQHIKIVLADLVRELETYIAGEECEHDVNICYCETERVIAEGNALMLGLERIPDGYDLTCEPWVPRSMRG